MDVFSNSNPSESPVVSDYRVTDTSMGVSTWAGRSGFSLPFKGKLKPDTEPGLLRIVVEIPLHQGCAAWTAKPSQACSDTDDGQEVSQC